MASDVWKELFDEGVFKDIANDLQVAQALADKNYAGMYRQKVTDDLKERLQRVIRKSENIIKRLP